MAVLKKNQVNQILFTMVDKTDYVTIEASLASNFTVKRFGANHGSAAANVSTLSRIVSKVGSGIYRLSLEANACNYDYVALRIAHASAATQVLVFEMRTYDDTDVWSSISDMASKLVVMSGIQSDLYSLLSDHHSDFQSRITKEVASKSLLSDVNSNLLSYLAGISNILSAVYVDTADISNILSNTHGDLADLSGIVSDVYSLLSARITKEVASKSLLSDVNSNLLSFLAGTSDIQSKIYALLSDHDSNMQSRIPKEVASKSLLSDVNSDLASKIGGITVTMGASDISDITSAILAGGVATQSKLLAVQALLSDHDSNMQSRVPKEVASKSLLSDVNSNLLSFLAGISDTLSDTNSKLVVMSGIQSDIYSLLSDVNSNFSLRIPKEVASKSLLSDVNSNLLSYLAGISDILSNVHGDVADVSNVLSNAHADLANLSGITSDIYSLLSARVTKEVASKSLLSDINSDLLSYLVGVSDMLSNTHSAATEARKILRNKIKIDSTTGVAKVYDDNNADVLFSNTIAADGDSTVRTRLAT